MLLREHELHCGLGPATANAYFVMNEDTGELIIVDPAGEADVIKRTVELMEAKPVAILLSHAHYDHMVAMGEVKQAYDIPIYAGEGDEEVLQYFVARLPSYVDNFVPADVDVWVKDGDVLELGGFTVDVLAIPGHSKGSVAYHLKDEKTLFCGDTLFRGSIGRTDFPEKEMKGDMNVLMLSIRRLLTELPDDTKIYPGHGPSTTVLLEKQRNPFVLQYLGRL